LVVLVLFPNQCFGASPERRAIEVFAAHAMRAVMSLLIVLLVVAFIACDPRIGPWIFGPRGPFSD